MDDMQGKQYCMLARLMVEADFFFPTTAGPGGGVMA